MPRIIFTPEEVTAALPKELNGEAGTARAWQMFSSMEGSEDAAAVVNATVLKLLTGDGVPYTKPDTLADALWTAAIGCVRGHTGTYECFGLSDSEPGHRFHVFARRLLGLIES